MVSVSLVSGISFSSVSMRKQDLGTRMPWVELKISSTVCRRSRVVSDRYLSLDSTATAPDWQSEGREEEFSALENYLRRYDLYCLAHHVPEITVYPYLAPLPEDALGLDRAAGRLEMLWAENQIFALFPESRLEPFWDAFCGRDLGLTENPCGAVLCHAAAAAALGTSGLLLIPEQVESARRLPLETLRQAILPLLLPLPPNAKSYALSAFDRKGLFLF